jgi:hypothetical protein
MKVLKRLVFVLETQIDYEISSKEYPETNESIQIMSKLAGDKRPQAPVGKGQNL